MAFQDRNPFDQFDSSAPSGLPQGAQVLIPESPTVRAKDQADLRNATLSGSRTQADIMRDAAKEERDRIAFAERNKPSLPTGYRWGANGQAERIPGLPATGSDDPNAIKETAATRSTAIGAFKATQNLDKVIRDIEQLYTSGPGSTRGLSGAVDWLPSPSNKRFDAAGNAARGAIIQALGFSSGQTNSPQEVEMNIGGYIPKAGDYDEVILDKIRRLRDLRNNAREKAIATLGGVPDENGRVTPLDPSNQQQYQAAMAGLPGTTDASGGNSPPPPPGMGGGGSTPNGPPPPGTVLAFNDEARPVTGERLSAEQEASVIAAIRSGDRGQALSLLQRFSGNAPDAGTTQGVEAAMNAVRQNPNAQIGLNYGSVDAAAQEAEDRKRFGGQLAPALAERANAGGVDTSIRAGVNGLTAGLGDYAAAAAGTLGGGSFGDNLQREQALTEADARLRPGNAMISSIAGGALGAAALEGGALRLLGGAGRAGAWAPRIGDAAYGGIAGATSALPGQQGQGALTGSLAGVAGGMLGRGAVRGAAGALGGVRNASVDLLRSRGVPLTVGQTVGQSGRFGQAVKGLEDRVSGLPIVGTTASARQAESIEGFNRAAFNEAPNPLQRQSNPMTASTPDTGASGIEQLRAINSTGYDNAVAGRTAPTDTTFATDYASAINRATNIPNGNGLADEIDAIVPGYIQNGAFSGPNAQAAIRDLKQLRAARQPESLGNMKAGTVRDAESAITGLFERQSPGFGNDLAAANATNTNLKVLEDAVRYGANTGEQFTPAQLNRASMKSANKFGNTAATTQRPFYDLASAGQDVLPSRVPDSGTAGRLAALALPGALGLGGAGAGYAGGDVGTGAGAGLALGALLTGGGSRVSQRALTTLLAERPDALIRAGEQLNRRARLGGIFGAPLLAGYGQ